MYLPSPFRFGRSVSLGVGACAYPNVLFQRRQTQHIHRAHMSPGPLIRARPGAQTRRVCRVLGSLINSESLRSLTLSSSSTEPTLYKLHLKFITIHRRQASESLRLLGACVLVSNLYSLSTYSNFAFFIRIQTGLTIRSTCPLQPHAY